MPLTTYGKLSELHGATQMAKLFIDAANGIVEIEADEAALALASDLALKLLERISNEAIPKNAATPAGMSQDKPANNAGSASEKQTPDKKQRKKGKGSKTKNWNFVPDMLDNSGWAKVKEFYEAKKPKTQNEKVAVFCAALSAQTEKSSFDGNEIHTAFKTMGEKTPANLTGVFGNMTGDGLGHSSEGRFQLDFKGTQMVEHDLPRSEPDD